MKKSAYNFLMTNKELEPILEYIYQCYVKKTEYDINDVAEQTFNSKSKVTRFFQNWGFDGYKEFKMQLLEELNEMENLIEEKPDFLVEQFQRQVMLDPINLTSKLNPNQLFQIAKKCVLNSKTNFILAAGTDGPIALELALRLEQMGFPTVYFLDLEHMKLTLNNLEKDDVVWVFSYTGQNKTLINLVKFAKSKGAKVILISQNNPTQLSNLATVYFKIDGSPDLFQIYSLKRQTAMNFIIYKLLWLIVEENPRLYNEKMILNSCD